MPGSTTISNCQSLGKDARLYYSTSGSCAVPVYVEHVGIIGDLNVGDTDDENQVQRRGGASLGIKTYNPGDSDVSITGTQIVDGNYEGFLYINGARKGGNPLDFLVLSGPISEVNTVGYRGKWYNFDRSLSFPAEGEMEQSFSLKPAACSDCAVRPVKVLVANTAADWDPVISS